MGKRGRGQLHAAARPTIMVDDGEFRTGGSRVDRPNARGPHHAGSPFLPGPRPRGGGDRLPRLLPFRTAEPDTPGTQAARKGQLDRALADLGALRERKPSSASVRGALGQLYLMDERPAEAEVELRRRSSSDPAAPPITTRWGGRWSGSATSTRPSRSPRRRTGGREDFEVYCLYCGLMAHHGRAAEVAPLFEFLKWTSIQVQRMRPKAYEQGLGEKFEFCARR